MRDDPSSNPLPPLKSQLAGDPEMAELVAMYLEELPQRIAGLIAAYDKSDGEILQRLSHQLKGASAGYGFPTIGQAAAKVEDALKHLPGTPEKSLAHVESSLNELVTLCRRAVQK